MKTGAPAVVLTTLVLLALSACADRGTPRTGGDAGRVDAGAGIDAGGAGDSGPATHCGNGTRDGDESHVDCGGSCMPCADGSGCRTTDDCSSGVCRGGYCLVPSCDDAVQNGAELGVDCGGGECPGCPGGTACTMNEDCLSSVCEAGACTNTSCMDGIMNSDESDIDCGGTICAGCDAGGVCAVNEDCASLICDVGACTMATCADMVQNQGEGDVDCGGPHCSACDPGRTCRNSTDCVSRICDAMMRCTTPDCMDGTINQDETDIDCGGATCDGCGDGSMCTAASDCESSVCTGGSCAVPTCMDGVTNGGESDTDCGGATTCPRCADYDTCAAPTDCMTAACTMGRCGSTGCIPFPGVSTDGYGYFGCTIPMTPTTLPCPDISATGTTLSLGDDGASSVPIGFSFDYYGTARTAVTLGANGGLVFDSTSLTFVNACLPRTGVPLQMVAVYWDDLYLPSGGSIRYQTVGTAPNRSFVARWNVPHISFSSGTYLDVTAVLHETSNDIDVCYRSTTFGSVSYDAGASATTGISGSAANYLQLSCNTATLTNGLFVQYVHP